MGVISFRAYLFIGLLVALFVFFIGELAAGEVIGFLDGFRADAVSAGLSRSIANLITEPLVMIFNIRYIGAIVAGLLWPFVLLWLFLFAFMVIFSFVGGGVGQVRDETLF